MSLSYAPTKLRVPPGFEHLLEGLTREVLRSQPKDIIAFSAEYFRKKIVLRGEEGIDDTKPSVHQEPQDTGSGVGSGGALSTPVAEEASRSIGHESTPSVPHNVEGERLSGLDISDPALNKAATVIQSTFRGHLARERLKVTTEAPPEPAVSADESGVMEDGQEEEKKDTGSESGEQKGGKDSVEGDGGGEGEEGGEGEGGGEGDGGGEGEEGGEDEGGGEGEEGGEESEIPVEGESGKVSKEDGVGSMVSVEGGSASEGVEGETVHGEKEEEGKDEMKVNANEGEGNIEPEPQAAGPPSSEELIKESESNSGELQQQGKETAGEQTVETEEQEPLATENTGGDDGMSTGAEREGD